MLAELGGLMKDPVGLQGREECRISCTSQPAAPLQLRESKGLPSASSACAKEAWKNIWSLQIRKEKLLHKNTNWETDLFLYKPLKISITPHIYYVHHIYYVPKQS